jgi:hypothetical protein
MTPTPTWPHSRNCNPLKPRAPPFAHAGTSLAISFGTGCKTQIPVNPTKEYIVKIEKTLTEAQLEMFLNQPLSRIDDYWIEAESDLAMNDPLLANIHHAEKDKPLFLSSDAVDSKILQTPIATPPRRRINPKWAAQPRDTGTFLKLLAPYTALFGLALVIGFLSLAIASIISRAALAAIPDQAGQAGQTEMVSGATRLGSRLPAISPQIELKKELKTLYTAGFEYQGLSYRFELGTLPKVEEGQSRFAALIFTVPGAVGSADKSEIVASCSRVVIGIAPFDVNSMTLDCQGPLFKQARTILDRQAKFSYADSMASPKLLLSHKELELKAL